MSTVSILGVILGIFAGFVNLFFAVLRHSRALVLLVRLVACLASFGGAGAILLGARLPPDNLIYDLFGLAIFIGLTLMVPTSIERGLIPAEAQPASHTTGTLHTGQPGVRVANQNDEWVN